MVHVSVRSDPSLPKNNSITIYQGNYGNDWFLSAGLERRMIEFVHGSRFEFDLTTRQDTEMIRNSCHIPESWFIFEQNYWFTYIFVKGITEGIV